MAIHKPTVLVILGATGDLVRRKIAPALLALEREGALPSRFGILGFSRRELNHAGFRDHLGEILREYNGDEALHRLLRRVRFTRGFFDDPSGYRALASSLEAFERELGGSANRIFYLAADPKFFEPAVRNLAASDLAGRRNRSVWTRLVVEKPFGYNAAEAEMLDRLLGELFSEDEIYRIDHYLGKELVQMILSFRFSNNLFEQAWSGRFIESIEIRLWETIGVESRGAFYDGLGALRDVGQNHLLQLLAFATMEHPVILAPAAVRRQRAELLSRLVPPAHPSTDTFRAQYAGYRNIAGVDPNSETETYFRIRACIDTPRWKSVPIILEAGKRMARVEKKIAVTFRHPTPCLCPERTSHHYKNKIIFSIEPEEAMTASVWVKRPGRGFEVEGRIVEIMRRNRTEKTQYTEEYAKLFADVLRGDQTLFLSTAEVNAMWRFIDPISEAWTRGMVPLLTYPPDSDEAARLADHAFRAGENCTNYH